MTRGSGQDSLISSNVSPAAGGEIAGSGVWDCVGAWLCHLWRSFWSGRRASLSPWLSCIPPVPPPLGLDASESVISQFCFADCLIDDPDVFLA